ncbi:hypothetical protein Amal_03014 [Acetobacter malorum]|uniref:Uncharacterized protein n=1 Tax=Acetobacter malorum TaxID=178901 RepID=A0A177G7Z3_9PROT|nr:hypothetical protein Amal_03014 [Acetobacter malorum]
MGQKRGGGRFPVGAGNARKPRLAARFADCPEQQFRIGQNRNASLLRHNGDRVRFGQHMRNAGRENEARCASQVLDGCAGYPCRHVLRQACYSFGECCTGSLAIIPCLNCSPALCESAHGGQTVPAQSQHSKMLAGKKSGGKIAHLNFSVARPHIPRMTETIQKRMTILGSAQPFFSKW